MSHALHRYGTVENLQCDYTFYARASRWVNREGCGPKLRKILDILLSEKPVNFGSSHAGKSFKAGLDPKEYASTLDNAYGVACCFSSKDAIKAVLRKLMEADTGISIVVSGLIDEIVQIAKELGLKPHTAHLSLGIHGKKALLPDDKVLEVTTMCGHGMVASQLTKVVMEKVKAGKMSPEQGAHFLAQPCPCGIFNTDRCEELLEQSRKAS
ncbi:MAG: hypothetical protein JRG73_06070 [Deltaproteobacteria bacterium]|nr:hypothetical protein [Deltaproteobacteria bacterium]MBW2306489.1 hypothetical protein [Deltaproteobacteria bacterium]